MLRHGHLTTTDRSFPQVTAPPPHRERMAPTRAPDLKRPGFSGGEFFPAADAVGG